MNPGSLHPAYLDAPPEHRWSQGLKLLWNFLDEAADSRAPDWIYVVLPHGAKVGMRRPAEGPRELVILRREPYSTRDGASKWLVELSTFRREFGCTDWTLEHGVTKEGGPKCTFTERVRTLDFFGAEE